MKSLLLCCSIALGMLPGAAAQTPVLHEPEPHEMLRSWLTHIATDQIAARRRKVEAIQTPEQVRQRGREVRAALLRMIGGLPSERTPLQPRRTGVLDRGDYRVEKIIFESSPRVYVTANLYVPQTGKPPYPAVLHPTGHSTAAKARAFYQTLSIGLVKSGFVVLTYDPLGQGERRLFYDPLLEDSKVGGTVIEHQVVGIQSLLAGESVARYMVWDAMRGVDLLASRPEVDPQRIGVAGCSGGGTLTAYLAALDNRLKAAAPACYITDWEEQLKGTGPQDAEQEFPDLLRDGFNHGDFLIAAAPMPYLMCSTEQDFFPLAGARKTFAEARRIYGVLGAEDRVAWAVGPGGHGMPLNVREAIYGWMSRWLKGAATTQASEPRLRTEFEEELYCTPSGQVSLSLGGDTASSLNIKRYAALPPPRPSPATSGDLERLRTELRSRVVELTRYQPSTGSLSIDEGEPVRSPGYTTRPIHFEPSPGRRLPARLILPEPESQPRKTLLYIGRPGADLDQLAQAGYTILAFEPSGAGETSSKWGGYAEQWFGQDKVTWLALMVGRPLVGIRIDDIRRAVDLLEQRGLLAGGCTAFAKGSSAIDLLFAAVLDDRIRGVNLEGGLLSYASIVRTPIHRRIFESVVPGVLKSLDLPQLVAALAPRPVVLRNLTSPLGTIEPLPRAQAEYRFARDAYQAAGAAGNLEIGLRREDEPVLEAYPPSRLSAASEANRPAH